MDVTTSADFAKPFASVEQLAAALYLLGHLRDTVHNLEVALDLWARPSADTQEVDFLNMLDSEITTLCTVIDTCRGVDTADIIEVTEQDTAQSIYKKIRQ